MNGGELSIENVFPVWAEGFDEDVLDGLVVLVAGVELAAALGLAEMDPVRSPVASALEARRFAERFAQDRADAIALVPVGQELALEAGEQMRDQARQADPGQDKLASVIYDQGQVALSGGGVPAGETVARVGFPGGGAEAEQSQQEAVGGVDEVAQMRAQRLAIAQVVVALDELVPETAAWVGGT